MQKLIFAAVLVLVLSGCAAKRLTVGSITPIKSHTGSSTVDVYAPARSSGQASVPEFAGDQLVEVRTLSVEKTRPRS